MVDLLETELHLLQRVMLQVQVVLVLFLAVMEDTIQIVVQLLI